MKSTKGLILLTVLMAGGLFVAFTQNNSGNKVLSQKQKLLINISKIESM
ncbi:MAG: hypothetical protein ACOVO1_09770 [Chitinophagaceae bacterium]